MFTYTRERLFNLRRLGKSIRDNYFWDTMGLLSNAALLRFRGKSAGMHLNRSISTLISPNHLRPCPSLQARGGCNPLNLCIPTRSACVPQPLKVGQLNARSVNKKSTAVLDLIDSENLDVLCLNETWHEDSTSVTLRRCVPERYVCFDVSRPERSLRNTTHGGVAIIARKDFCPRLSLRDQKFATFECVFCSLKLPTTSALIGSIYRCGSRPATNAFFDDFISLFTSLLSYSCQIFICGDINIHFEKPNDNLTTQCLNILETFGFVQLIDGPTHVSGGCLDLVITRSDPLVENIYIHPPAQVSDHSFISFTACNYVTLACPCVRTIRCWRNFSIDAFTRDLVNSPLCWDDLEFDQKDPSVLVTLYNDILSGLVDLHAPLKTIKVAARNNFAPWFDEECKSARRITRAKERAWLKNKTDINKSIFTAQRKTLHKLYQHKEINHWVGLTTEFSSDSKKLWQVFNSICNKSKGGGNSDLDPTALSNFFKSKIATTRAMTSASPEPHFKLASCPLLSSFQPVSHADIESLINAAPTKASSLDPLPTWLLKSLSSVLSPFITKMFNASLMSGSVPQPLKIAAVTPILKKPTLDPSALCNYRPISNLAFISKTLEKVVSQQVSFHLKQHDLLPALQSAYRPFHSTETALLKVISDIATSADAGQLTALMLVDQSAAFDCVDHAILLKRLHISFGLSDTVLDWCTSYFHERSQFVLANGMQSPVSILDCGVPQGSVLGPLFFSLYTSDILDVIQECGLLGHMYADDTQCYKHFYLPELFQAIATIQTCFDSLSVWMASNRLKLNPDKTEVMVFGSKHNLSKLNLNSIVLGGVNIQFSAQVRNLGVILDPCLTFESYANTMAATSFYVIRELWRVRPFLTQSVCTTLVCALVLGKLDYCNSLLAGCTVAVIKKLQSVQNAAARLVWGARPRDHIQPLLYKSHWLKIPERISYKINLLTFKSLNGLAPQYLSDSCVPLAQIEGRRTLRSNFEKNLLTPRVNTARFGRTPFAASSSQNWNRLPLSVKDLSSIEHFKSQLKSFLFTLSYPDFT